MKKETGKIILRLFVVALAIALVVLILLNTVFKVPSTQKAYNALNTSFGESGTITSMVTELDDLKEFNDTYGNFIIVFNEEIKVLQQSYPKLYYLKGVDDGEMDAVTAKLDDMQSALTSATKLIQDVNTSKAQNKDIDVKTYVERVKPQIITALGKVVELNNTIQDFLVNQYYGGAYTEIVFVNKIKTLIAKEYFVFAQKDYASTISNKLYNFYIYLKNSGLDKSDVNKVNNLHTIMKLAKDVDFTRVVIDNSKYRKEKEGQAETIEKIATLEAFVNSIKSDVFKLQDLVEAQAD